jgi:hypothetical protein
MCAQFVRRSCMIRLAIVAGMLPVGIRTAAAAGVAGQVHELLDSAWKPSSENFAAAHQLFDQAKAAAPNDMRVPLAMALLSVKNFKNDEAAKYVDMALPAASAGGATAKKIDPLNLSARRLKIYLQVLRKDQTGAQASMHDLAALLGTDDTIAPSQEAKNTAEWLGGVLGYYAGPAAGQGGVNVDALQNELATQMKGALANVMADGKAAALKQFDQLKADQAAALADIKARLAAKRSEDLKKTQTAQTALAEKMKNLDSGKVPEGKAKTEDRAAEKLKEDLAKIEQTIAMQEGNPRRNEKALQALKMRRAQLMQQMSTMANSTQNAAQQEEAKKQAAEAEKKQLQAKMGTLEAKTKQLAGGAEGGVSTPVDAKLVSISSYAPVDLEKEKQRILESYAAK